MCIPYRKARKGDVAVRRFDGQSWTTLPTLTRRGSEKHSCRPGGRPARVSQSDLSRSNVTFHIVEPPYTIMRALLHTYIYSGGVCVYVVGLLQCVAVLVVCGRLSSFPGQLLRVPRGGTAGISIRPGDQTYIPSRVHNRDTYGHTAGLYMNITLV